MNINTNQIRAFNALLNRLDLQDQKRDIIYDATGGRSEHTKDMTFREAQSVIDRFNSALNDKGKADRMRKKILHYAHLMQWYKDGGLDLDRIDRWCLKYGHAHKKLNNHSVMELNLLVTQFERLFEHYLNK